jgi:hypothetical protein
MHARYSFESIIKLDPTEVRYGGTDWIILSLDRDQCQAHENTVLSLWISIKY